MTEDPLKFGSGINFYEYAGNNPRNYTDPSGEFTRAIVALIASIGALFGGFAERKKGIKCKDTGVKLAVDTGRGAVAGAGGAVGGLVVTEAVGPYAGLVVGAGLRAELVAAGVGGASGSAFNDFWIFFLGGGGNMRQSVTAAVKPSVFAVLATATAGAVLPVSGGENWDPLKTGNIFGPKGKQFWLGEGTNHALDKVGERNDDK